MSTQGGGVGLDSSVYPGVSVVGKYSFADDLMDSFPDTTIGIYRPVNRFVASVGNYQRDSSFQIQVFNNSIATSGRNGYIITQDNINDVNFTDGVNITFQ